MTRWYEASSTKSIHQRYINNISTVCSIPAMHQSVLYITIHKYSNSVQLCPQTHHRAYPNNIPTVHINYAPSRNQPCTSYIPQRYFNHRPPRTRARTHTHTHTHTHTYLTPGSQARGSDTRSQHAETQKAFICVQNLRHRLLLVARKTKCCLLGTWCECEPCAAQTARCHKSGLGPAHCAGTQWSVLKCFHFTPVASLAWLGSEAPCLHFHQSSQHVTEPFAFRGGRTCTQTSHKPLHTHVCLHVHTYTHVDQ